MAYMVMQRVTTAVHEGYAGRSDLVEQLAQARRCRGWLEALSIDPTVRAELLEPIRAVEEALGDLVRAPEVYRVTGRA